jgi:hypothetical protein
MEWAVAIGVDTHEEMHVAVALDALGAQLVSKEISTTPAGYRRLLAWAQELGVPAFAAWWRPKERLDGASPGKTCVQAGCGAPFRGAMRAPLGGRSAPMVRLARACRPGLAWLVDGWRSPVVAVLRAWPGRPRLDGAQKDLG